MRRNFLTKRCRPSILAAFFEGISAVRSPVIGGKELFRRSVVARQASSLSFLKAFASRAHRAKTTSLITTQPAQRVERKSPFLPRRVSVFSCLPESNISQVRAHCSVASQSCSTLRRVRGFSNRPSLFRQNAVE